MPLLNADHSIITVLIHHKKDTVNRRMLVGYNLAHERNN